MGHAGDARDKVRGCRATGTAAQACLMGLWHVLQPVSGVDVEGVDLVSMDES